MADTADAVPLSLEAVRVLASKPRFEILHKLHERRMTSAEVADSLGMSRGKAHAHLLELARVGFAKREVDERVWVYYSLTPTGERLAKTPRPKIVILLGSAASAAILAAALFVFRASRLAAPSGGTGGGPLPPNRPPDLSAPPVDWLLLVALLLTLVGILTTALAAGALRESGVRPRAQRSGSRQS